MDISLQYTKRRSNFGRQPMFCEAGPELCDSVAPDMVEQRRYILRNPVHQSIQHTPLFSRHDANTIRAEYTSMGINHAEGGWPRDVNVLDPEATQRYRRKIEKDDPYIHCVMTISEAMEHYVMQNNAIEMYQTYYSEMSSLPAVERIGCRTLNVYHDGGEKLPGRMVSSICWQVDETQRFVVTYGDMDFNRVPRGSLDAYVWDVHDANAPETTLTTPCALLDLQFNPRERDILAGGLVSGQVGFWDRRSGGGPVGLCPPHVAHRDLVRSVLFINSKSGQEFYSGGPDGVCKWWDMRNLSEPTDEMVMDFVKGVAEVPSKATANGISKLEYEPTIPARFMVGTENGLIIVGNRKGKTPLEKLTARYEAHNGPVWSLQRNPGFAKNFLSVGEWTLRVWSDECRESAVLWSPPQRHSITDGIWSPTRLSVLMSSAWDGSLRVWDLLRRQHEPVLTIPVCREPLLRLAAHDLGTMVACGSRLGRIYVVELSQTLAQTIGNEKQLLTAMFEREARRERILEARLREIRLKLRQAEGGSPTMARARSAGDIDPTIGDRDLAQATADYMATVKRELAAL